MNQKLISIIVPVYNKENTVKRCIESLQAQTYKNIEIILVDDGSSDGSRQICSQAALEDDRIRYVPKKNGGVGSARNEGIRVSKGEYLQFVDADDYIDPKTTEIMFARLFATNADLAICGFKEKNRNGKETIRKPDRDVVSEVKLMEKKVGKLFENCFLQSCCNKLYRKDYIRSLFPEDYSYGEDLIFNLDYFKEIEKVVFIPESFYIYDNLNSGASLTSQYRKNEVELRIRIMREGFAFCEGYLEGEDTIREIAAKMMRAVIYSFFDAYADESISLKERKEKIRSWVEHPVIQKGARMYVPVSRQQKLCNDLIKKKKTGMLLGLLWIKKTMHLYAK